MTKPDSNQLIFTPVPYRFDLALEYFKTIEHLPWSMLLHSAAKDHPNSRFDILVAEPVASIIHQEGTNFIQFSDGQQESNQEAPLLALERLQQRVLKKIKSNSSWPFIGGALGFFSYDLGRQIEALPTIADKDSSLPDMAVGIYDWAFIVDHQEQQAVLIEQQGSNKRAWLDEQKSTNQRTFRLSSSWQSNMSRACYQTKFDKVKEYILAGDCYQINLAQRFSADYQGSEWQAYQKLAENNAAPFSAFIRLDKHALLSLSPERFLSLQANKIETKPIKGTRPRNQDKIKDAESFKALQQAPKDRAENLMIVDLLRNDIGRVAKAGSVKVPSLFAIESFPAVHHLVSTVTGQLLPQYTATDLLQACFPGGSITGAPKVRAMEIIEELEPHRRTLYCGSIGYISRCGKMDTSITIRTLVCERGKIRTWAGGGLVMDSEVNAEYQETLDKLNKILPIL